MLGLGHIVREASWPHDCPRRRRARMLLVQAVGLWLGCVTLCVAFGLLLAVSGGR